MLMMAGAASIKVLLLAVPCSKLYVIVVSGLPCCCLHATIAIAIAIVGLHSGCSCCCAIPVALGGKDIMGTKMLMEDVSTLLMLLKDC